MPQIEHIAQRLKHSEGFRSLPYRDSVGKFTIGYGTNLDVGIDKVEAEFLLQHRLFKAYGDLTQHLPWVLNLSESRLAVLIDMTYNMGIGGLLTFKNTLRFIQAGNYDQAADNMLKSKWARQVKGRALKLAAIMRTGEDNGPY